MTFKNEMRPAIAHAYRAAFKDDALYERGQFVVDTIFDMPGMKLREAAYAAMNLAETFLRCGQYDSAMKVIFIWSQNADKVATGETTWETEVAGLTSQTRWSA